MKFQGNKTVGKLLPALLLLSITVLNLGAHNRGVPTDTTIVSRKVDSLLSIMSLPEKIGQLNQVNDDWETTGPATIDTNKKEEVRKGLIGSILNCNGAERTRKWQKIAMQSRLKIPLLFGQDVIHGYKTTFPIPLAESCSWDLDLIEKAARVAATEASAAGIHWTFAPMVDIARDPRWGRVMEGSGEDTYLASKIAAARVRGFQGDTLGAIDGVMACAKHFAAYGAAIGGRDYNSVDMSERQLREFYLPPFKAAVDAGAATFMTAFNDINGIPSTANRKLLTDILRGEWGYTGFVVSDWGAVGEMQNHGTVANESEAAVAALTAGCDMDMESRNYLHTLENLVHNKMIALALIDTAVKRVLLKKFEMGLFDDPYKYCNEQRELESQSNPAHVVACREMAQRSILLLKNEGHILPLNSTIKTIACIGPLFKEKKQNKGSWDVNIAGIDSEYITSQWEGLQAQAKDSYVLHYAKGCEIEGNSTSGFAEALRVAKQSDVVILSLGEKREMTGEAKSRSDITLPGKQEQLFTFLQASGKPIIVIMNAGRPLVFNSIADNADAILYTWWLGSEAGNAIADVIFGKYNPSAKLTMSFPLCTGQIPIYYNHLNTGRPAMNDSDRSYRSAYIDLSLYPKYPFGFGLSYTSFSYSNLRLSKKSISNNEALEVQCTIKNTGSYYGEEIVQLYLHDKVASVSRPVMELKDFAKIKLLPGASQVVTFHISRDKLSFYNNNLELLAEPGEFDLMIGASSSDIRLKEKFVLEQ